MDALHDNSHRTWLAIANAHEALIPKYVLESTLLEKDAADAMPATLFADTTGRLFPLDTPADVWLSAAYFAKNAENVYKPVMRAHIEANIKQAADIFGIAKDCDTIQAAIRLQPAVKQASDGQYGWVTKTERLYPMFDEAGVKLACAHFVDNRDKYPMEMRRTLAKNISKRAEAYGVQIPDEVRRESCVGMPRRDTLMLEIIDRSHLVKDASIKVALLNLNELVAVIPMDQLAPELEKIASALEEIDATEGLHKQYGKRLLAPADIVFSIDVKEAAAVSDDAIELDRYMFSLQKLAGLDPQVYSDALGDDFAARISQNGKVDGEKLANELNSLIRPDRIALEQHLESAFG